jgi:hypothetical protein
MDSSTLKKLLRLEKRLVSAQRLRPLQAAKWATHITKNAGVYVLWSTRTNKPVYVGETVSLHHRMGDISRTVNHTFRRRIARLRGWTGLSESELSQRISRQYVLSYLELHLGRAELEEFLVLRWSGYLANKTNLRVRKGRWYQNVRPLVVWPYSI